VSSVTPEFLAAASQNIQKTPLMPASLARFFDIFWDARLQIG
jgi:hypothetical protein